MVTHLRKPVVGVASLTNFLGGCKGIGESSICCRRSDDSNQKRHVISAASSDKLPPLSFTDLGIWNDGAIAL